MVKNKKTCKQTKTKKPLFPKPVDSNSKKQVNTFVSEMISYGKSVEKTLTRLPQLYRTFSESPIRKLS